MNGWAVILAGLIVGALLDPIVQLVRRWRQRQRCRVYWGSHGCEKLRWHRGPHLCRCAHDDYPADGSVINVGAPPYYGPDTYFYGEDA